MNRIQQALANVLKPRERRWYVIPTSTPRDGGGGQGFCREDCPAAFGVGPGQIGREFFCEGIQGPPAKKHDRPLFKIVDGIMSAGAFLEGGHDIRLAGGEVRGFQKFIQNDNRCRISRQPIESYRFH